MLRLLVGIGAAYGTCKSGMAIAGVGIMRQDLVMKVSSTTFSIMCQVLSQIDLESDTGHHGWDHSGLFTRGLGPHR